MAGYSCNYTHMNVVTRGSCSLITDYTLSFKQLYLFSCNTTRKFSKNLKSLNFSRNIAFRGREENIIRRIEMASNMFYTKNNNNAQFYNRIISFCYGICQIISGVFKNKVKRQFRMLNFFCATKHRWL